MLESADGAGNNQSFETFKVNLITCVIVPIHSHYQCRNHVLKYHCNYRQKEMIQAESDVIFLHSEIKSNT